MSNNLDPARDFETGTVQLTSLHAVQNEAYWVETDVLNHDLSTTEPYMFTLLYIDGGVLSIPLSVMFSESLSEGGSVLLVRRHKSSGRLVPFQIAQNDVRMRDPSLRSLPAEDALVRVVPPRFDSRLTPTLMALLNEAQAIYIAIGFLRVFELHLMNPLAFGWSAAAAPTNAVRGALGRMALRRGAGIILRDVAAVGEGLLGEVSELGGTGLQRYLEFARRLSAVNGLTPKAKADLLVSAASRLGLDVGGQALVKGGRVLVIAKDGKTAFQIAFDGTITFGRFNTATLDIANPTVIRPFVGSN
jgi:hypothetical protein